MARCWCGSGDLRPRFRTSTFGLVRCGTCGCYRIDPPPISGDDEAATFYSGYYERPKSGGSTKPATPRSSRFWQVVRADPSLERAGEMVADIGCGEGHLCGELRRAGWTRVVGVDVSRTRVERARKLYPDGEFYDRPLEEAPVPEGSFDLIIMDNVIEHLPEPVLMLRTLRRYLKPAGRIVVITPNMSSGHFKLLGRRWTPELAPHAHIYLFTPPSMRVLLSNAGFWVDRVGNFHLPVYSPVEWTVRLLSADVKGAIWRAGQELGGIYGRLIGTGPMLYSVATPSDLAGRSNASAGAPAPDPVRPAAEREHAVAPGGSSSALAHPGVTVVICTYQRPESTVRVLDSLVTQSRIPDDVLVVDASTDRRTSDAVTAWQSRDPAPRALRYFQVEGSDRGLTRQRNFALDRTTTDLVVFFDDDVVLGPNCLRELERVLRGDPTVVGVGCFAGADVATPRALWRLRRRLQIVSSLEAGKYHRSGMSTPWEFDPRREPTVEGDWLPGWGMMWKTSAARAARFHDGFAGYAQGEDLDFSLRLRRYGRLLMAREAEIRHLPDPAGRPDPYRQGYMEIYNGSQIHRRGLADRTARDVMWFAYAWTVDTLLLGRHLLWPSRTSSVVRQVAGRFRAAFDLLRGVTVS